MQSSHNLFKYKNVVERQDVKKIETTYIPKKKEINFLNSDENINFFDANTQTDESRDYQSVRITQFNLELEKMKKKYHQVIKKERDKFFKELRLIKENVIESSYQEGELLKKEAYQSGLKEGRLDGYEVGKVEGYQAGIEESEYLKKNALKIIEEAKKEVVTYQKEKQSDFVNLASIMAEKIINKELSLNEIELSDILQPVLNKLDKDNNFITIFVTKSNFESTKTYMQKVKNEFPSIKFAVFVDDSLELNGCVIDTNFEVIDLQIRKQLDLMVLDITKGELNE